MRALRPLRAVAGGIAVAALAGSLTGAANAQAGNSPPVTVSDCSILQYVPIERHPFWRPFGPYPYGSVYTDGIRIAYVDRAAKTATRVAFLVNYRGDVQRIIDIGTFSPGVTIDHQFGQFTGDAWLGPKPNVCRVVAVRYADGSFWHAPAARLYPLRK